MNCKAGNESNIAPALFAAVALFAALPDVALAASVSDIPDADSFVRSAAPASNYGVGGALSVSGEAAVNDAGDQNGLFDTLIRFPSSNIVASLDVAVGSHGWVVTETKLVVTEMAAPDNAIFDRGVGAFEVRFQVNDNWLEGTGKPNAPTADGVAWNDLAGLVNSNLDVSLGVFTNAGINGQEGFTLALADALIAELRQGNEVSLHLTAVSPEIGFTFNSRDFGNTNAQPRLEVTALQNPNPVIDSIASEAGNVVITFSAATNWVYRLQRTEFLSDAWADVLRIPAQNSPTNVVFVEPAVGGQNYYRLAVSAEER